VQGLQLGTRTKHVPLLNASYRAFVHVFCPACGWSITFTEGHHASCRNPDCPERFTVLELAVKVMKIVPVADSFKRGKKFEKEI